MDEQLLRVQFLDWDRQAARNQPASGEDQQMVTIPVQQ
jgi:hypothetical protein